MSITSSATASRDHDVPSTEVILGDRLCLVLITRKDDTPMDASSISEEDIVEICIKQGYTHPLGVLWYSTTELVVLFRSLEELKCTTHGIAKMAEFWGEAIMVRAMAPLEAHITVYIVTSCRNPSNHSPVNSPKWGKTAPSSSRTWRPWQPWAASAHGRPHVGNCAMWNTCTPSNPPPNKWVHPSGSREPKEDDQEVTFHGGGRWGPPRQPTSPVEPERPAEGRVPSGLPLWAPCPAPSGSDMGQLITTLTSSLCLGTPKINTSSGNVTPVKTEVSFEQWNHEVHRIKDHYPESVVWESIMRSLKGAAADMAQYMDPTTGVSNILEKTFGHFWNRSVIWCFNAKLLQNYTRK